MTKNILYEIFGITTNNNFILNPGNNSVNVDLNRIVTNPYSAVSNQILSCLNLNIDGRCLTGCHRIFNSIPINSGDVCPVAGNGRWGDCSCYSNNLLGNADKRKENLKVDPYDFNKTSNSKIYRVPLTGWQHDIYEILKAKNKNLIISIPPGGGKTRPIKAYFFEMFVKYFADPDNNKLPKILYIVPTRQLAGQIKFNDFIRDSEYGILAAISNLQKLSSGNLSLPETNAANNQFINALNAPPFMDPIEKENFILSFAEECVTASVDPKGIQYKFSSKIISRFPFLRNEDVPVILCVNGSTSSELVLSNISKVKNVFDHVIVDEVQESIPKPQNDESSNKILTRDSRIQFETLCKSIKEIGRSKTKIHLLTGSVNDESLTLLNASFKSILKVDFEFVPDINAKDANNEKIGLPTDGTSNRSKITVVPLQALSSPDVSNAVRAREKLIKDIVNSKQSNSIMIVFSTKQFAKQSLLSMLKSVVNDLPKHPQNYFYDNDIKQDIPLIGDNLRNKYIEKETTSYIGGQITNNYYNNNILARIADKEGNKHIKSKESYDEILKNLPRDVRDKYHSGEKEFPSPFSKKNINIPGDFEDRNKKSIPNSINTYIDEIEFLKYFDVNALSRKDEDGLIETKDESNLLYQGILSGIGIMTGAMNQQHKDTVQKLFAKRKIYLLISTDALGIGANVDCKHLYIPTINKFDDGGFGPLNQSSLTQIINRVGRGKFPHGFIYCREEDSKLIDELIKAKHEVAWKVIGKVPFLDELVRIIKSC